MSLDTKRFHKDMTIGEAMGYHPEAGMVFASYHLGSCSHCAVNEEETIAEVCTGYGIPLDDFLNDLNSLFE